MQSKCLFDDFNLIPLSGHIFAKQNEKQIYLSGIDYIILKRYLYTITIFHDQKVFLKKDFFNIDPRCIRAMPWITSEILFYKSISNTNFIGLFIIVMEIIYKIVNMEEALRMFHFS
jgi:hypothetical protein